MASDALPLPEQTPQSNESFAKDIAEKMMSDKARTRAEKKKRHREKYKLAKRTKPGSSEGEGIQLAVRRAANLRRRRLQKALDTKDKMGLTKLGSEQLMRFCSKKASTDVIPAMGELEPSAQKVLAPILAQEYDELMAWPAEREPGQVPKDKKEESGNETKLGAKEEKMGGQDEIEMEDLKEEWEQEWGPEPVSSSEPMTL